MTKFVIDENVFENAITNQRPDGSHAHSEKIFTYRFFSGKDTMFINKAIKTKFIKNLPEKISTKYNSVYLDNHIIPSLKRLVFDSSRTNLIDGIKTEFKGVKKCDTEFVGVTLQSDATLVTADKALKIAMRGDELVSKCKCSTVDEVLENDN